MCSIWMSPTLCELWKLFSSQFPSNFFLFNLAVSSYSSVALYPTTVSEISRRFLKVLLCRIPSFVVMCPENSSLHLFSSVKLLLCLDSPLIQWSTKWLQTEIQGNFRSHLIYFPFFSDHSSTIPPVRQCVRMVVLYILSNSFIVTGASSTFQTVVQLQLPLLFFTMCISGSLSQERAWRSTVTREHFCWGSFIDPYPSALWMCAADVI